MLLVLSANDVVVIFWVFIGEVQPPSPLFDTAVMTTDAHATVKVKGNSVAVTSSVTTPHCYMPTASQQGFIFLPLNCQLFAVFELFDIELYSSK